MAVQLTITADTDGVRAAFNQLIAAGGDPHPPLREIGTHLRSRLVLRFQAGIAPDGTPWKPAKRPRPGGKLLVDRGHLRNSFNWQLLRQGLVFGSALIYAAAHHFGVNKAAAIGAHTRRVTQAFGKPLAFPVFQSVKPHTRQMNLPARPLIGWTPDDANFARAAFNRHLAGSVS